MATSVCPRVILYAPTLGVYTNTPPRRALASGYIPTAVPARASDVKLDFVLIPNATIVWFAFMHYFPNYDWWGLMTESVVRTRTPRESYPRGCMGATPASVLIPYSCVITPYTAK